MRNASVTATTALLLTMGACRDSGPPAPLPPSAAFDPGWQGAAHVPQLRDAAGIYDRLAPRTVVALSSALLICHVDVAPDPRDNSPPDLVAWLRLGARHAVWVRAPYSNAWTATVSWPAVDLVMGEELSLSIYDEDTWSNDDHLATFETRFDGRMPIVLGDATATVECRAAEPAEVEAPLRGALAEADRALDALATVAPPDLLANHWERPSEVVDQARRAIAEAAALVGWHVPAVTSRVAREQAHETAWAQQRAAHIEHLARTLPAGRATMTCDAVVIDRALPASERPRRPATACLVTLAQPAPGGILLYSPEGRPLRPSWNDGTRFLFAVPAVDVPAIRLATRGDEIIRVR